MKNSRFKIILTVVLVAILAVGLFFVLEAAAAQSAAPDLGLTQVENDIGLPATDIRLVVARIIRAVLGFLGIIAVVLVLYGGFVWMTAGGNEDQIARAKKILINAAIGLAIILASYAIVSFVISRLGAATGLTPGEGEGCVGTECETPPWVPGGGDLFYIDQLPAGGQLCIRNVHPVVVFNRAVDLATLAGNLTITLKSGGDIASAASVNGEWRYSDEERKNTVEFVPQGACGAPDNGNDCLMANTTYVVLAEHPENIKTADGVLVLNCAIRGGCGPKEFITGNGIDRLPPRVEITYPENGAAFELGALVPVSVAFSDDNGLQNISLYADGYFVESKSLTGCQKSGAVTLNWPTNGLSADYHSVRASGVDWSGGEGAYQSTVLLRPAHCFDNTQNADESGEDCGGADCGACSGSGCKNNGDCSGGFCKNGTCLDKMTITGVSPLSGAPGTLTAIVGRYFGENKGKVFFARTADQSSLGRTITDDAGWVEARYPSASCTADPWRPWQILVEVPEGAVSGPIKVVTVNTAGAREFVDYTDYFDNQEIAESNWGPDIPDFVVNSEKRPGLCAVNPDTGAAGSSVTVRGKDLGVAQNPSDNIIFGSLRAVVSAWTDNLITATVPGLDAGYVSVKVSKNGVESNGLRFRVTDLSSVSDPIISGFSPARGAKGEYITITGKNFGVDQGRVWFRLSGSGDAIDGSFDFPVECKTSVWQDDKIIVKFPLGNRSLGQYSVQVVTGEGAVSRSGGFFTLESGQPSPGICRLDPDSAPVPLPTDKKLSIYGEYFSNGGPSAGGEKVTVYFWAAGAQGDSLNGRKPIDGAVVGLNQVQTNPTADILSGPVLIVRKNDIKISNPADFSKWNCVENNNTCTQSGERCCAVGSEAGICKPETELCEGETRAAGYMWRFSTREIVPAPRVVERCEDPVADGNFKLPSPSPSIQWNRPGFPSDDHVNVCRGAAVVVEFNSPINNPVNAAQVLVNECGGDDTVDVKGRNCTAKTAVTMNDSNENTAGFAVLPATENNTYIEIFPAASYNGGQWKDDTWYQVVLKDGITVGAGDLVANLSKTNPCTDYPDSAYCFVFKTDARNCGIKGVVITPYEYTTNKLEEPMTRADGTDLYFEGHGVSDQRCIIVDAGDFDWKWEIQSGRADYAAIFDAPILQKVRASALANTVGVGLSEPQNAVEIYATASTSTLFGRVPLGGLGGGLGGGGGGGGLPGSGILRAKSYTGTSTLTIDLSNPAVMDFWPQCKEACVNAAVGLKFNIQMSDYQLNWNSVLLYECADENCVQTFLLPGNEQPQFAPDRQTLRLPHTNFKPDTVYKVVVSSETDPAKQLWSIAKKDQPQTKSKPFAKEFTWTFRTKAETCVVNSVKVEPEVFTARRLNARAVYFAESYGAPDECSVKGQKLDSWNYNWNWTSADENVATVSMFTTKGKSPYCTDRCLRKGSDIPAGASAEGVCGNGAVEAGEDCDIGRTGETAQSCTLNCLRPGNSAATCGNGVVETQLGEECDTSDNNSKIGCSSSCLHLGSEKNPEIVPPGSAVSYCGSGQVGAGEDCDTKIKGAVGNSASGLGCDDKCLHTGTKISKQWCEQHSADYGGFASSTFTAACSTAVSRCGDGEQTLDEDAGCDLGAGRVSPDCTDYCLLKSGDTPADGNDCSSGSGEGCDRTALQHAGSSLKYTVPSLCGDFEWGTGEDRSCEDARYARVTRTNMVDPWVLATGVGAGTVSGDPPTQSTDITATVMPVNTEPKSGKGKFEIPCGYSSDAECQAFLGDDWGVGEDTCCYHKPVLTETYPARTPLQTNVCPNTAIEARFSGQIDSNTLANNLIIARGQTTGQCVPGMTDVSGLLALNNSAATGPWYQHIFNKLAAWFKNLFAGEALSYPATITATTWCAGADTGKATVIIDKTLNQSRVIIGLVKSLATSSDYAVILKDGIRDTKGVSIGSAPAGYINWKFITGSDICRIDSVQIEPAQQSFYRAGESADLLAHARSGSALIQAVAGYAWDFVWTPQNNPIVTMVSTTEPICAITAKNQNGEADVFASARLIQDSYYNEVGKMFGPGRAHVIVLLCENPWPPKDPAVIFPYEDKAGNNDAFDLNDNIFTGGSLPASPFGGYFNFKTYYCADNGITGNADDLPYLRPAVQVSGSVVSPDTLLKRFIFTNDKNGDAIGIQIFPNSQHLTLAQWYAATKEQGGQGFAFAALKDLKSLEVDGYQALSDGNNIYVDALNYGADSKLYTNVYLFSVNADATAETKKVFEEFVKNLTFNNNLSNDRICTGGDGADPQSCKNDFDCPGTETCSAQTDKLKRNYYRLRDLSEIAGLLDQYNARTGAYPDLKEGTFLSGQTLSTWPSWTALGTAIGAALPADPVNRLGISGTCASSTNVFCVSDGNCPSVNGVAQKCVLHDSETGWSTDNRRFSFACTPASYAYRYFAPSSADANFTLKTRFEDMGVAVNNWNTFVAGFVSDDNFITDEYGICNSAQEISSLSLGRCGDGIVNYDTKSGKYDECDPPQSTKHGECVNGVTTVFKCSTGCSWQVQATNVPCSTEFKTCGNGRIEAWEKCDDGRLNGTYNHCNADCQGFGGGGRCGNGIVETGELCDPGTGAVKYGANRAQSCNWDCQSYGPYCGDGVVQAEFGEECEGDETCAIGDKTGMRFCANDCKIANRSASSWWRMNPTIPSPFPSLGELTVNDVAGSHHARCSWNINNSNFDFCPHLSLNDSVFNRALSFDGANDVLTVDNAAGLVPVHFSFEAWFKSTGVKSRQTIVEKIDSINGTPQNGFTVFFNPTGAENKVRFTIKNNNNTFSMDSATAFDLNEWHQVIGTYDGGTAQLFVDGNLENSKTGVALTANPDNLLLGNSRFNDAESGINFGFQGMLDEVLIYPKVLTGAEVKDSYENKGWFCSSTYQATTRPTVGCGNGIVESDEACDLGIENNGQPCTPPYGRSCTYCDARCQNIVTVEATAFCGNGRVDASAGEKCDTDPDTGLVYASAASAMTASEPTEKGYLVKKCADEKNNKVNALSRGWTDDLLKTYKKGERICADNCQRIQNNCVECGLDLAAGVKAVAHTYDVFTDQAGQAPITDLYFVSDDWERYGFDMYNVAYRGNNGVMKEGPRSAAGNNDATINANAICSSFSSASENHYKWAFQETNRLSAAVTTGDLIDAQIVSNPKPWQYDFILSPVVPADLASDNIRIVVSWVANVDFLAGLLFPEAVWPARMYEPVDRPPGCEMLNKTQWHGYFYQDASCNANNQFPAGVMYLGNSFTGNTKFIAVDVSSVNSEENQQYPTPIPFYVKVGEGSMDAFVNSARLRVDIYYPEDYSGSDPQNFYLHYSKPSQTFILDKNTINQSQSQSAKPFWHVFNIQRQGRIEVPYTQRIVPINRIVQQLQISYE